MHALQFQDDESAETATGLFLWNECSLIYRRSPDNAHNAYRV